MSLKLYQISRVYDYIIIKLKWSQKEMSGSHTKTIGVSQQVRSWTQ
jgi:hypothetical protein